MFWGGIIHIGVSVPGRTSYIKYLTLVSRGSFPITPMSYPRWSYVVRLFLSVGARFCSMFSVELFCVLRVVFLLFFSKGAND